MASATLSLSQSMMKRPWVAPGRTGTMLGEGRTAQHHAANMLAESFGGARQLRHKPYQVAPAGGVRQSLAGTACRDLLDFPFQAAGVMGVKSSGEAR